MPTNKNTLSTEDVEGARADEVERLIDGSDGDDEDFFLKGPSGKKSVRFAGDKIKDVQVQIAEVTDAMRDNVGRLLDRGDRLDHLQTRSENLSTSSDQFRSSATRMSRAMWWQNTKSKIIIVCVAFVIILVITVPIIVKYKS